MRRKNKEEGNNGGGGSGGRGRERSACRSEGISSGQQAEVLHGDTM